jgi:hypothetical protein
MKKAIITIVCTLIYIVSAYAQEPVASETKETEATKTELFSFTKMFIADKWQNANNALVNADEESGVLQVASETQKAVKQGMGLGCIYDYSYSVRFRVKDNKYRVEIYDVRCTNAEQVGLGSSYDVPFIEYFEGDEPKAKTQSMGKGATKKQAKQVMEDLRSEFAEILSAYSQYIQNSINDDF